MLSWRNVLVRTEERVCLYLSATIRVELTLSTMLTNFWRMPASSKASPNPSYGLRILDKPTPINPSPTR